MYKQGDSFHHREDVSDLMNPIKVLVVDHKYDWDVYVSDLLHSSFFEVTRVGHSSEAIRLLSKEKSEYDLVLISHDMSHVDIQTLLRQTKHMDLLSIVTSDEDDDAFVLEVFKSGAFLVLKTPLTIDALRHVRQDVIRERMHRPGKCENKNMTHKTMTPEMELEGKSSSAWKDIDEQTTKAHNNLVSQSLDNGNDGLKKRSCMEWTPFLCEKFDNALIQLGEGRCYPTEIHKLMNVPGLTKRQVASHLQKHRNNIRKSKEKQSISASLMNQSSSSNVSAQAFNDRKYGSVSPLETFEANQEGGIDFMGINQTEIDASLTYGSIHKNISQATEYNPLTYGNGLGLNQHEGFYSGVTATTGLVQEISGLDHQPFSSDQTQAYDDFLIYSDGNGQKQDSLFESFSFSHDHVMQNEGTTRRKKHM